MSEYGMSLKEAFWDFPMSVALVLMPIYVERKSGDSAGPNYAQDEAIKARNKCRTFLKQHYTIVDDPTLPWVLS